jgi:predicted ribosomally synthesized peptide with nif11-like leader
MSKSNVKKLVDKLSKDTKFREELLAEEAKVALKFAKKAGLECTAEELKEISAGVLRNATAGQLIAIGATGGLFAALMFPVSKSG